MSSSKNLTPSKPHFKILDGLRGLAAVCIVIFHFMEFIIPNYVDSFIAHSYLAVDFFFCLSGLVIAYAYDEKIKKIGFMAFLRLRLIRLQPLVFIGAIIGLLLFIFDPFKNIYTMVGFRQTLLMFLSASFLIPFPAVPERYNNLFYLNPPTWSLFWEYIANIFYALFLFKINNKVLWLLMVIGAIGISLAAYHYKFLGVGWGEENFFGGFFRIFFSFLAGMLVYRSKWKIKSKLGFLGLSLLLVGAFLIPYTTDSAWLIDVVIVVFYFPFLVALGAGAVLNKSLKGVCEFSGKISYPLYMIHYPFLWVFYSYIEVNKPGLDTMIMVAILGVPMLVFISYLVMRFLDTPIRSYLKAKERGPLTSV